MPSFLTFPGGSLEIAIDPERLLVDWQGPPGKTGSEVADDVRARIESPPGFPALGLAVVAGDRVIIALDADLPCIAEILAPVVIELEAAGIRREDIVVMSSGDSEAVSPSTLPPGIRHIRHDPEDATTHAYLATTESGKRIYLNREDVEADFVLPIGLILPDAHAGIRGPWTSIYPGLRGIAEGVEPSPEPLPDVLLEESTEVGWLLGNLFQIGVIPGVTGVAEILAGPAASVLELGTERINALWTIHATERADLVAVSVGDASSLDALWSALGVGASLVRRGGKVVAISSSKGTLGPAACRLLGEEIPGPSCLRGAENEPDYLPAKALATALAWADLYVFSAYDPDVLEDLGIIPLSKLSEAKRLIASANDVAIINHAEWTRVKLVEDDS